MSLQVSEAAPASLVAPERRGRAVARFCHGCQQLYPALRAAHVGRPVHGRDHVSSPCAFEGERFTAGADWWEEAVEVLPAAVA